MHPGSRACLKSCTQLLHDSGSGRRIQLASPWHAWLQVPYAIYFAEQFGPLLAAVDDWLLGESPGRGIVVLLLHMSLPWS